MFTFKSKYEELPVKMEVFVYDASEEIPKFLLVKRCPEDGGFWQPITGTMEFDESLKDCIVRELEEETGIKNIREISPEVYRFSWPKKDYTVVEVVYAVDTPEKNVTLSHEHVDFKWCTPEEALVTLEKESNKKALLQLCEKIGYILK